MLTMPVACPLSSLTASASESSKIFSNKHCGNKLTKRCENISGPKTNTNYGFNKSNLIVNNITLKIEILSELSLKGSDDGAL
jgi:hypothetical protein